MKRWPTKPLGEVLELSRERVEPTEHPDTPFNYVGLESIEGHTGKLQSYQPTLGAEIKSTKNVFHTGEVLYGKLRPYLNKVHLASADGICSTDIYVLRPRQRQVHPSFAANYLRSPSVLSVVSSAMAGANLPRIGQDALLAIPIPVPPLVEQERIVKLLDEADELRKLRAQADRRSADFIPALFHEMFGDPLRGGRGWPMVRLDELCIIRRGASPRPIEKFLGGTVPWIKIGDGTSGDEFYITHTAEHIIEEGKSKSIYMEPGSLIFANCGVSLGFARILKIGGCIHDGWLALEQISSHLDKVYLLKLINLISDHFRSIAPQGTQPNLNTGMMKNFCIPLPPLPLQKEFTQRVGEIRALQAAQAASRQRTEHLFQSMLHRAFNQAL